MPTAPDDPSPPDAPAASRATGASDDRYRPLFALSPQPAWIYASDTLRFLEVNEAAVHRYGWTREEFLGMTLHDIRPPADVAAFDRLLLGVPPAAQHTGTSVHRTKNGRRRTVEINSYPLLFDGRPARMVLVHDVSDQLAAADALARSEEKYRSLIDHLQDVFFRTEHQGLWTFLNPAWQVLTGHAVAASLGTHFLTYVHPSDRSILLDALRPLAEEGMESASVEIRYFHADGGYRWVEANTRAVRDEHGALVGTTGTLRDVTERRAADEERNRLATDIRQLLDASGEGIVGLDARGIVTFVNRRGSDLLGFATGELIGRSLHDAVHYSHADGRPYPVADCPMQRAATDGIPCAVDDEVLWRQDGAAVRVEYVASPVRQQGRVSGAVVNFRDITARKRAELELIVARDAAEAANRAKSDFLARMSHELRTPLNSIIGFANVLLKNRRDALGAGDLSYLSRIATNGRHLLGLINDILDLSKIEAGHMALELRPVSLDRLVRETVDEMEGQTRDKPVTLRAELPPYVFPIEADEGRMRQVLVNLIGNALKFTDEGEVVVRLSAQADGRPTVLQVSDTGIGIPPDRLDAIFNVFEQAESMITRRYGGTGLGLAISRSLCELMGHRLEVTSIEGKGTTMTVLLGEPARTLRGGTPAATPVIPAPDARDSVPDATGQTVLVVDDDVDARLLLTPMLEETGCRVVHASTGVEALRLAREVLPGLIFLDLRLPRISGFDVLRILQADEALRDTPVVVASVVGTESRSALAGAAAILDKPLDRQLVFDVVRRFLVRPAR